MTIHDRIKRYEKHGELSTYQLAVLVRLGEGSGMSNVFSLAMNPQEFSELRNLASRQLIRSKGKTILLNI